MLEKKKRTLTYRNDLIVFINNYYYDSAKESSDAFEYN